MSAFDLARVRADTPACANLIHFNNAGASLMPRPVVETVIRHLRAEAALGGYEAAEAAAGCVEEVYRAVAALLNCGADEIALTENATRGWDMALHAMNLAEGDRVLTHCSEYGSNHLALLQLARRRGIVVDVIGSTPTGVLNLEALEGAVQSRTRLIAITHVPSHRGLVNPVVEVGDFARRHGLIYLLDASQAVGQMVVDVDAIGCHMLAATGRKFLRAPRGTGLLFVRRDFGGAVEPPFIDLHAAEWRPPDDYRLRPDARRFESWESSIANRLGLGAAAGYAAALGLRTIESRVRELAASLRAQLEAGAVMVHERGPQESGIVTFDPLATDASDLAARLRSQGVNVSLTFAGAAPLDHASVRRPPAIRASPHYFNTEDEIARFCALVIGAHA